MFSSSISSRLVAPLRRAWSSFVQEVMAIPKLTFAQINEKLKNPQLILLDVREVGELSSDGKIAGSKNIPVGEIQNAVKLDDSEFEEKYGFPKPQTNDEIVVHCKAGVRAENAAKALLNSGYQKVEVYPGILDWASNGGKLEK